MLPFSRLTQWCFWNNRDFVNTPDLRHVSGAVPTWERPHIYAFAVLLYLSARENRRPGEEHGSAKWGNPAALNKKYASRKITENKILTQNVAIGLDGRKHRRNLNILVVGGSGAGKTRFFAKPGVMNASTSYVCLDPNGEISLLYF